MRDRDLYATILGIRPPWEVVDVVLDDVQQRVEVRLALKDGAQGVCPECGQPAPGYDTRERKWRHLDTCQFQTILAAAVPRINCREHGVKQIRVPWAEEGSRFTALFEALTIDWLKAGSITAVSGLLRLTWDEVSGIMGRAVERGLARRERSVPRRMGVDETSFAKRHEYVTVVSDQDTGAVVLVGDGRGREALDAYYVGLSAAELTSIDSVSMDMSAAYIAATVTHVPDADRKICFDKFHVASHLGSAVDLVRRREHRELTASGDSTLSGTRYVWLKTPANMTRKMKAQLEDLRAEALLTAKAWYYKEWAMGLWHYGSRTWAKKAWAEWYRSAVRTNLEPIKKAASTVKRHLYGIINAVVLGITNAHAEGLNSGIQRIKAQARGFRNRARFRNAIYFHFGQLDLYPSGTRRLSTHTES